MKQDLIIIALFAGMIFLFLANFGILGPVGNFFSGMMFGLCGVTAYILPIMIFGCVLYYEVHSREKETPEILAAAITVFLVIGMIAELSCGDLQIFASYDIADLYTQCAENRHGGGILAGSLAYLFYHLFGVPGTILVIVLALALSAVILSQKPLVGIMRDKAKRARKERIRRKQEEERYKAEHPEEFEPEDFEEDDDDDDFDPEDAPAPGDEDEEAPFEEDSAGRKSSSYERQNAPRVHFFRGTPGDTLLNPASFAKHAEKKQAKTEEKKEQRAPEAASAEELKEAAAKKTEDPNAQKAAREAAPQVHTVPQKEEAEDAAPEEAHEVPPAPQYEAPIGPTPKEEPASQEGTDHISAAAAPVPVQGGTPVPSPEPEEQMPVPASQDLHEISAPREDETQESAPEPDIQYFEGVAPIHVDQDPIHLEEQYDAQQENTRRRQNQARQFQSENLHEILPGDFGLDSEENGSDADVIAPLPENELQETQKRERPIPPLPSTADLLRSFVPEDIGREKKPVSAPSTAPAAKKAASTPDYSRLGVLTFEDDEAIPPAPPKKTEPAPEPSSPEEAPEESEILEEDRAEKIPVIREERKEPEEPAPEKTSETPIEEDNAPSAPLPEPLPETEEMTPEEEPAAGQLQEEQDAPVSSREEEEDSYSMEEEAPSPSSEQEWNPEEASERQESYPEENQIYSADFIPAYHPAEENSAPSMQQEPYTAAPAKAPSCPEAAARNFVPEETYSGQPPVENVPSQSASAPAASRPAFRNRTSRDFVTMEAASDASDILVRKEGELSGKQEIVEEAVRREEEVTKEIRNEEQQENQTHDVRPISEEETAAPVKVPRKYIAPPVDLLTPPKKTDAAESEQELRETAAKLQSTLETFGVRVHITEISQGPAVTRYEMQPELGVKVSKILSLQDDIKLALAATEIRIEAPIPGKSAVGVEVPNRHRETVSLREVLDSDEFKHAKSKTAFGVGRDLSGRIVVTDIAKMPHVLIAGATGSGKSVCINTMIMSILFHASPREVKLIMIDPKIVELSVYNGIPHLMLPVVTDPQKAAATLNWCVAEMENRFRKFADNQVRDIKGYNALVKSRELSGDDSDPSLQFMPSIVIIVDELADLMMVAKNDVETAICRLAQLARAAGMHLVIATQRPSVDVITGLIKANMPSRIAFAVTSGVDSRTILDMNGAEKLLGKGDMLFFPQSLPKPQRIQGAFVTDDEVTSVVNFLKTNDPPEESTEELEKKIDDIASGEGGSGSQSSSQGRSGGSDREDLFVDAGRFIIEKNNASIGLLQRRFRIGFNKAARIMDELCEAGVVSESEGTKSRRILMNEAEFQEYVENNL